MDFIDDFIQEYKNNPCLWKADSVDFKNRSKRQEAYMKLINVASKHGEHYNIERTKQKINNLRCAFRHQLKKYIEFKNKGEKDEPYCPKRRYFESLLFLKDEECPDRKPRRDVACSLPPCTENNEPNIIHAANSSSTNSISKDCTNSRMEQLKEKLEKTEEMLLKEAMLKRKYQRDYEDIIQSKGLSEKAGEIERKPVHSKPNIEENLEESEGQTVNNETHLGVSTESTTAKKHDIDYSGAPNHEVPKKQSESSTLSVHRKRSSSLSPQLSKESESVSKKASRTEFTTVDFEKVFSLACKSIHSNMDDHYSNFGKLIAHKLRSMDSTQAIYAEKIIADVLFHGQMKLLSALSVNQFINMDCSI